jgi:predicted  nucleic acid-binding Zn-ribbon protein
MYTVNSDETISITSQEDVKMVFIPKETMDSSVAEMQTKLNEAEEKVATLEADISTKIEALVKASEEVTALTNEVSTLMPFKEEADKLV